jgi:hypothetical protein
MENRGGDDQILGIREALCVHIETFEKPDDFHHPQKDYGLF